MKKDSADEQIRFDLVRVDGPPGYSLDALPVYFNGKFSHWREFVPARAAGRRMENTVHHRYRRRQNACKLICA